MCCPRWRSVMVIIGGILVHLTLGAVFSFGNLTPYMTSYLRNQTAGTDLTYSDSVWIYACSLMGQGFAIFIGGVIGKRLGVRITTLLGAWFMSAGVCLTFFTIKHSYIAVIFTYGIMNGLGVGIGYPMPMACAMKWLPHRKGLAGGLVVGGFGGGAFIFNLIQTAFINPDNLSPDLENNGEKFFTQPELLVRVPWVFLVTGGMYAAMQLIGVILLRDPPPMLEDELTVKAPQSLHLSTISTGEFNSIEENGIEKKDRKQSFQGDDTSTVDESEVGENGKRISFQADDTPAVKESDTGEKRRTMSLQHTPTPKESELGDKSRKISFQGDMSSTKESEIEKKGRTIAFRDDLIGNESELQHELRKLSFKLDDDTSSWQESHYARKVRRMSVHLDEALKRKRASVDMRRRRFSVVQIDTVLEEEITLSEVESLTPTQVLRSRAFYTLWLVFLMNGQGIVFLSSLYKDYGQTMIKDDVFLAMSGAFAAAFNFAGRMFWGALADKFSFKSVMMCLCATFTCLIITFNVTEMGGKPLFFIYVCLLFGTLSGNYSLLSLASAKAFGPKYYAINFGLVFTSQVITAPLGAILSGQLKADVGWFGMFGLIAAFSFVGFLLIATFNIKDKKGRYI